MATKVVYTLREDKKDLQKQFGCMNGIFQLFDRRYLLGLHRHGRNQNKLIKGEGENGGKEFKNSSEKVKEKDTKRVVMEKNRVSVDSSRNSCSSSCSSTTFSSLDCGRRVKPEIQISFEPTSPYLPKNQPDIREVVKDSMTRTIRVSSLVKNEQKEMKHIDSPRPIFVNQKSLQIDRKDRNLAKEGSRFSCDERESKYSLKSTLKVKEVPRFSLDSKQNSKNFVNTENTPEPGSNKRPSSGVVPKLMGLESFDKDSIVEVETIKIKPFLDHELVSRLKGKNGKGSVSVYGEMEKRLSGIEFKTSGKDLRALKQILEAMKNKERSLDSQKMVKPVSPMVKGTRSELVKEEVKPEKLTKVNYGESRNDLVERKKVKDLTPRKKKVTSGTPRLVTCQNLPGQLTGERLKKSKKRSTDLTRIKTKNPKMKSVCPMKNNEESCIQTRNDQRVSENVFVEKLIEEKTIVELPKLIIEEPSPVSVLDVFYNEDTISPLKNKTISFKDYETSHFDENHEMEWKQVENYNLDFLNNEDHIYISEILSVSGFLKDLESAIKLVQIHPTGNLIKSELFNFLEKKEQYTNECHKKTQISKRKMVFDFVNEILLHKLTVVSISSGKRRGGVLNGEKLLKEVCSELDNLQIAPERFVDNEDDEVKILVSVDMNNKSQDWEECCEIPGVVLDIERLIFKDLIDEVVNADMACPRRQCRR